MKLKITLAVLLAIAIAWALSMLSSYNSVVDSKIEANRIIDSLEIESSKRDSIYVSELKVRDSVLYANRERKSRIDTFIEYKYIRIKDAIVSLSDDQSIELLAENTGHDEIYPAKTIYNEDTVVAITMDQVDSVNITYASVDQWKEHTDSLKVVIKEDEFVIFKDSVIIGNLSENVDIKNKIIDQKDNIIESGKAKNKKLKLINRITIAAAAVLGLLLIIK